jgi:hypothetical protein
MSGDAHVRFCESLGLQRPGPLTKSGTKRKACEKTARARYASKLKAKKTGTRGGPS